MESKGYVEICVELDGYIEDYLSVGLFSVPGTAVGKCFTGIHIYSRGKWVYIGLHK